MARKPIWSFAGKHTDFIFAVYGEEFGLLGCAVLVLLYLLMIGRCFLIAANASTLFGRLMAGSMTLMFFTYAFVNMGMVTGMFPSSAYRCRS